MPSRVSQGFSPKNFWTKSGKKDRQKGEISEQDKCGTRRHKIRNEILPTIRIEGLSKNQNDVFCSFRFLVKILSKRKRKCPRPDLNWHRDLTPQRILSPVRLPIPPLGHYFKQPSTRRRFPACRQAGATRALC